MATLIQRLGTLEKKLPPEEKPANGECILLPLEVYEEAMTTLEQVGVIESGDVSELVNNYKQCRESLFCDKHRARLQRHEKWDGSLYHPLSDDPTSSIYIKNI